MKLYKKLQNSKGQMADIIMFFIFISFVTYFIFSYTSMQVFFKTQNFVDEIVRNKVEQVRTKGIFTTNDYNDLLRSVGKYGKFSIMISLQRLDESGNLITYVTPSEILDKPLKIGNFLKIYAEATDRPLFAEMLSRNFLFGFNKEVHTSFKMQAQASGMVCSDGFIRGLEAINLIERYNTVGNGVTTKTINPDGSIRSTRDYINSTYSAASDVDPDWIKPDGRFQEDIDRDVSGNITKITLTELIGK